MGPLGELGALFNPGMRHEIEERKSKANRREEEGNARDGDLRIDLASGVAVINLSAADHGALKAAGDSAVENAAPTGTDGAAAATRIKTESTAATDAATTRLPKHRAASHGAEPEGDEHTASRGLVDDPESGDGDARSGLAVGTDEAAATRSPSGSPTAAPMTAAQARRLAAAARRSAGGDRPARPVLPRPANAPLPSSKASRAAR